MRPTRLPGENVAGNWCSYDVAASGRENKMINCGVDQAIAT